MSFRLITERNGLVYWHPCLLASGVHRGTTCTPEGLYPVAVCFKDTTHKRTYSVWCRDTQHRLRPLTDRDIAVIRNLIATNPEFFMSRADVNDYCVSIYDSLYDSLDNNNLDRRRGR